MLAALAGRSTGAFVSLLQHGLIVRVIAHDQRAVAELTILGRGDQVRWKVRLTTGLYLVRGELRWLESV